MEKNKYSIGQTVYRLSSKGAVKETVMGVMWHKESMKNVYYVESSEGGWQYDESELWDDPDKMIDKLIEQLKEQS